MPILLNTTEIRWFLLGEISSAIQDWYSCLGQVQNQPPRTDLYLPGSSSSRGIKLREGRLEIKLQRKKHGCFALSDGIEGCVESWIKWGVKFPFTPRAWIPVQKTRQILYYQVTEVGELLPSKQGVIPSQGGGVELTQIQLGGDEPWWTIGIEVFGPGANQLSVLHLIARFVFKDFSSELFTGQSFSFPKLLQKYRGERR